MVQNHLYYHYAKIQNAKMGHNSGTSILLDMQFVLDGRESSPLSSCKNLENSLELFFVKSLKK